MISSRLWPHFALQARYGCAFQHRAVSHAQSIPRTSGQGRIAATVATVASMQRSGIEGRRRTPTTVSATRSTTAGAWSRQRNRSRFAATIGKGGMVAGLGVVERPARVATPRPQAPPERGLGFRGSLSCRLRQLRAHKMSDVLPRFHFVASRLRLLTHELSSVAKRRRLE